MVRARAVCAWIAVILVAVGLPAGPAAAQPPPVVSGATYMGDMTVASRALTRVGTLLNGADTLDALVATVPRARRAVVRFDRRMYAVSRYCVADPAMNRQRARLAGAAPPVTDVLTRYLDAVLRRDQAQMMALSAAVTRRTAAFSAAGNVP